VAADAEEVGTLAADAIGAVVADDPTAVIGVATGSSPLGTYVELGRRARAGALDFRRVTAFALDEYVGLAASDPRSYAATIEQTVTRPLGLRPENVHVPDGGAADPAAASEDYERLIARSGGVRVQVLGIGSNGHLGFNEPGSPVDSRTRMTPLSEQTRLDNARFFPRADLVPTHCITQGLGTILEAGQLVLVAQGEGKARAIARALDGPVDIDCPASVLQLHPAVTVILDRAAASLLRP